MKIKNAARMFVHRNKSSQLELQLNVHLDDKLDAIGSELFRQILICYFFREFVVLFLTSYKSIPDKNNTDVLVLM